MRYQVLDLQNGLRTRLLWILIPTALGCVAALLFHRFVFLSDPNAGGLGEWLCLAIFPIIGFLIGYSRGGVPDYVIDTDGIKRTSIWGHTKTVRWSEIDRIRFIKKRRMLEVAGHDFFNTPITLSIHLGSFGEALFNEAIEVLKRYLHPHFDLSEAQIPATREEAFGDFVLVFQELKKWARMRTIGGHIFALTSAFVVGTVGFALVMGVFVLIAKSGFSENVRTALIDITSFLIALSLVLSIIIQQKRRLAKMDERKRYEELGWQWRKTQDTRRINPM